MDWTAFFQLPSKFTVWDILDSQFLTTILAAAFGVALLRYESKLREAQNDARAAEEALQASKAAEREQEDREEAAPPAPPVTPGPVTEPNHREEARLLIDQAKDYLLERAKQDGDGRHKRTYEKISGHYPLDLAVALRDRGQINSKQFNAAFSLFSIWSPYSRGKGANNPVPTQVYNHIRKCKEMLVQ